MWEELFFIMHILPSVRKVSILRFLSTLLILCLLLLPVSAFAEPAGDYSYTYPEADSAGGDYSVPYDPLLEGSDVDPAERHADNASASSLNPFSLFALTPQMVPAEPSYPRVLLSTLHTSVDIVFSGNYCLYDTSGQPILIPESGFVYTLSYAAGKVSFSLAGAVLYSGEQFVISEHTPPNGQSNNFFSVYNTAHNSNLSYLGSLAVYATVDSTPGVYLVNRVYMEDYLCGVVPFEIGEGYGAAALQAQAVAARNYAYSAITNSASYDLLDTSTDQVYKGISSAPNSAAAVEATDKKLLTFGNAAVEVFYSASNGGITEIPSHRWTNQNILPAYIEIKADPYDLRYGQKYGSNAYLEEITIPKTGLDSAGMLKAMIKSAYSLTDTEADTIALTAVTLSADCADESHRGTYEANKGAGAYFCSHFATLTATCTGSYTKGGIGYSLNSVPISISASTLKSGFGFKNENLSAFWLVDQDGSYIVRHGRYGHGIGLSQIGARQMAAEGRSVTQILTFYYPNTALAVSPDFAGRQTLTALPALTTDSRAVIYDSYVYLRTNTGSLTLGVVKAGTAVVVTGEKDAFYSITFDGKTGYVQKSAFTPIYGSVAIANVTTSCNVRSEPSTAGGSATIIGQAPLGASYALLQANAAMGWHKISYNGQVAYVSATYARLVLNAGTVIGSYPITVTPPTGYTDLLLWVDGVAVPATNTNGVLTATVHETNAKTVVMYKLRSSGTPQEMYAWTLSYSASGGYTATPLPASMQNLLTYHGCAIRVTGNTGLRFISGINQDLRAQLLSAGIEGFRLVEYGTVVINNNSIDVYPFTKGGVAAKYGRSYWDANNDYYINITNGRIQFASVLVDIQTANYNWYYGFRPYVIVEKGDVQYTFYGGQVSRSMYHVAKQIIAAGEFAQGTAAYVFVNNIVKTVEGNT